MPPNINEAITCKCCGRRGYHGGRNLTRACYVRHARAGTLHRFPRNTKPAEPWQPTGPHGRLMVERYQQLADARPPLSVRRIAFELGVTERQVWRYAAATRTTQTAAQDNTRSEAA